METTLPRWGVRLNATRPASNPGFSDLIPVVSHHFNLHVQAAEFLGPYNAKQRGASRTYCAPDKETLRQVIKQGRVNDFTYQAFLNSIVRFCEQTKGNRAVPTPHPSVIHSIQLPLPAFELTAGGGGDIMVQIAGVQTPLVVKGLRQPEEVRFIIVRPKLSQLGTASAKEWEVLFWRTNLGYIPEWADSSLNPRYSGIY
jgi:hypothetical protein